jgi:hypothetical protein
MKVTHARDVAWADLTQGSDVDQLVNHDKDRENPGIPSGYTYFGQFAVHDLSNISLPSIALGRLGSVPGNLRAHPLRLDSIFGAGPLRDPHLYEPRRGDESVRSRLKLGVSGEFDLATVLHDLNMPHPADPNDPDPRAAVKPLSDFPKRDLPRAVCPFAGSESRRSGLPEVTIADPRNDDNLIVGQTTVLFHTFYNRVLQQVRAAIGTPIAALSLDDEILTIDAARTLVTDAYRRIIKLDYLERLLSPTVYQLLLSGQRIESANLPAVPLEFSHAAFRFGHVMIRKLYTLNDSKLEGETLRDVLLTTGSRSPEITPLTARWLVQWSKFYAFGGLGAPNLSVKIAPFFPGGLLDAELFPVPGQPDEGGLHNLDLQRGASVRLRSVNSLIDHLNGVAGWPEARGETKFLTDAVFRADAIRAWLLFQDECKSIGFSSVELEDISQDPPLLFFVLFEAAVLTGGSRLGPVGSMIVGETFFRALDTSPRDAPDENPILADGRVEQAVFGGRQIRCMSDLIDFAAGDPDTATGTVRFK